MVIAAGTCLAGGVRRTIIPLIVLSVGLGIGGGACGDDDSSSTTSPAATTLTTSTNPGPVGSASGELCDAREALRASINDLTNVDVVRNGTSAIGDALGTVTEDLRAVRSAAGSDLQAQADAFQQSLDTLQTTIDATGTTQVTGVVTAIRNVGETGATLLTSLGNLNCP